MLPQLAQISYGDHDEAQHCWKGDPRIPSHQVPLNTPLGKLVRGAVLVFRGETFSIDLRDSQIDRMIFIVCWRD